MKFILIFLFSLTANAADLVNDTNGVALDGYDVVAYFINAENNLMKGTKGSSSFLVEYEGVKYYFSSEENKKAFSKDPKSYLPAYGGWCAWAVAQGQNEVKVNYDAFTIQNDEKGNKRLFLFYKTWLADTKKKWLNGSYEQLSKSADKNWVGFSKL